MGFLKKASKEDRKFLNPVPTEMSTGSNMMKVLWKFITNKAETSPVEKLETFQTDTEVYKKEPVSGLRITLIGHSSVLIEVDGIRILTDPVWSQRASFSSFIGPKRFFDPPLLIKDLPKLDAIIISHDHYDHLDKNAIRELAMLNVPFYCSLGVGKYLEKWGVGSRLITELDWTDKVNISKTCELMALPARHFSGRSLFNRFETLWSSFIIRTNSHNIYYGADSGWFDGFKEIGDTFGPFQLTMLEIGAYNENWADIHMGPLNAINAHLDLRGQVMMPIHWGTFNLALHPWKEPIERLLQYAEEKNVSLFIPKPGEPTEVNNTGYNSEWWM